MPIQTSVNFNLFSGPTDTGNLRLQDRIEDSSITFLLNEELIVSSINFLQELELIFSSTTVFHYDTTLTTTGTLSQFDPAFEFKSALGLFSSELTRRTYTNLVVGDLPVPLNPFRTYAQLYLTDPFLEQRAFANFSLRERDIQHYLRFNVAESGGPSDTTDLTLTDEIGPEIFNEVPASGSSYNNPSTGITFDLIDTGSAIITPSSIRFTINDNLVVDAGVDVTSPSFGTTLFTKINDSFYTFDFTPANPFDLCSDVVVSGRAADDIPPDGNLAEYLYSFRIWGEDILNAEITGLPDVNTPILDNINPAPLSIEAPTDTNISFDLYDEHTGVNFDSVVITVEGNTLISGADILNTDYALVTQSAIYDGRGRNYVIDPVVDLPFSTDIDVTVYAEDLYSPANVLDTSYFFTTQTNAHLVVSGLSVFQDAAYETMFLGESYVTASSTPFYVDYVNTSGVALDMTASYVALNDVIIPSTYTSISGDYYYRVFFNLQPDYEVDANLTFYIQQSGTVYGNVVDREYFTRLLWGYEVCYNPEDDLSFDTNVFSVISVCDYGDFYSNTSLVNKFKTAPMSNNILYGSIVGINPPFYTLTGEYISNNTFYEYGKTMNLTLEAEDFAGNKLIYNWNYTIEENN